MKWPIAVLTASFFGLMIRTCFIMLGDSVTPGSSFEIMSVAIIFLSPFLIGFLTIFLLPREEQVSNARAFFLPWLTCLVLLIVTMVLDLEGSICWVMIFPVFAITAGIGGVIAKVFRKSRYERIQRPDGFNVSLVVLLPLVAGLVEGDRTTQTSVMEVHQDVYIDAPPSQVWYELTHIGKIYPNEHKARLSNMLGFPAHSSTVLDTVAPGGKRTAYFEKGLYFKEEITEVIPERKLVLAVRTEPDKIPPTVMDEHILIGGKHLNMDQDVYLLEPVGKNACRLRLSSRFVIATPFNWYAGIWARTLMQDMLGSELNLIRNRAMRARNSNATAGIRGKERPF